jgi:hypothetical protein
MITDINHLKDQRERIKPAPRGYAKHRLKLSIEEKTWDAVEKIQTWHQANGKPIPSKSIVFNQAVQMVEERGLYLNPDK